MHGRRITTAARSICASCSPSGRGSSSPAPASSASCSRPGGTDPGTLQERLVVELRLAGANALDEANAALATFLPEHNRRFQVPAVEAGSAYRPAPRRSAAAHSSVSSPRTTRCAWARSGCNGCPPRNGLPGRAPRSRSTSGSTGAWRSTIKVPASPPSRPESLDNNRKCEAMKGGRGGLATDDDQREVTNSSEPSRSRLPEPPIRSHASRSWTPIITGVSYRTGTSNSGARERSAS